MADEPDPPRKFYALKPREFEVVNPPASAPAPTNTPTDVRGLIKAANARGPLHAAAKPAAGLNDVQALLRENHERANAMGLNDVAPPAPRRSRRKRDYWLFLVLGNASIVGGVLFAGPNIITVVYGFSGVIFFTVGFTWLMWVVLDDY